MVFCQKLVFLGLTLGLLAHSVSGGPWVAAVCFTACNAVWFTCVSGITGQTCGAGFPAAVVTCNTAQQICFAGCTVSGALPTP
jgi:hypothetical protein